MKNKRNNEYWQKRFEQLEKASHNEALTTYNQVEQEYIKAQKEIERQINNWYVRVAENNQISMADAKKLLNSNELKEFKWNVQEYIKYGEENRINNDWMKELENASAKYHISRLEALKIQTQQSMEVAFGNQLDDVDKLLKNTYTKGYYHTAFEIEKGFNVGYRMQGIDQDRLNKIISKPWAIDERNFSERIWGNKNTLINELHQQLTRMCLTGGTPDKAIKYMSKKFNTSKSRAGNLIMTESAYFSSLAQKDCFNELDVEKYEIVATLDIHTSEICREQDGKVYEMKDFQPGITAPPFHNYCRSVTVPHFDDDFDLEGERAARDENGKTYYVSDKMKYDDWYNKYIKNTQSNNNQVKENLNNTENNSIIKALKKLSAEYNVGYNQVKTLDKQLTDDEIIQKIGGGDKTKGSCSSLALSYIANKNGLDVIDFRGGESQNFFATNGNILKIAKLPGIKSIIEENSNDITAALKLLKQVEEDKEYYLAIGEHAAIVRNTGEKLQYLELQTEKDNGFKNISMQTLKKRFGCKQTHSVQGIQFKVKSVLIDIDSFKDNEEFKEIMGYINTPIDKQVKGAGGYAK